MTGRDILNRAWHFCGSLSPATFFKVNALFLVSCEDNLKFYGPRSRAVWSAETNPPDHVETSVDLKGRGDMSKRTPPTREQLLAMIAHSSWEKKVALV